MQGGGGILFLLIVLQFCLTDTVKEGNEDLDGHWTLNSKQVLGFENRSQRSKKSGLFVALFLSLTRKGLVKSGVFEVILRKMKIRHKGGRRQMVSGFRDDTNFWYL